MKVVMLLLFLFYAVSALANAEYDQQYRDWKQKQPPTPQVNRAHSLEKSQDHIKISINQADKQIFQQLSGIGDKKAQAIIDYRIAHGPFKSIDDLKNIKGIGDKIIEKNKDRLVL